jgi:hypothetical protein
MNQKDVKARKVMKFDQFAKSYDQAHKTVKSENNPHPGMSPMKGEDLFVRNDANPYKALGIPHDEAQADINPKHMNANQVDVFHGRKLTPDEKKKVTDAFGHQVVTHHQMAFILDEGISDEIKMAKLDEAISMVKETHSLEEMMGMDVDQFYYLIEFLESDIKMIGSEEMEYYSSVTGLSDDRLGELYTGYGYIGNKYTGTEKLKSEYEALKGHKWEDVVKMHDESITEDDDGGDEEDKKPELTDEDYKKMYDGKKAFLNGDGAKITDEDGSALIKSDDNEMRTSWSNVHKIMTDKGGLFRTTAAPKKDDEDSKEKKKEKKKDSDASDSLSESKDPVDFTIPNWAVAALINGDETGLTDDEQKRLAEFVEDTVNDFGNANFMLPSDDELDLGFCTQNDIDGRIGGDCTKLLLIPSK